MTQTLLVVVLFVAAMATLPWLVRRVQQRQAAGTAGAAAASRVLSAVAVGPQQRVVTVEVGPEHARTWLVAALYRVTQFRRTLAPMTETIAIVQTTHSRTFP